MKNNTFFKSTLFNGQVSFLIGCFIFFLSIGNFLYAQEVEFKKTSIKTGVGLGINGGEKETGLGLTYSVGWQKSYGEKGQFRLNPNLLLGNFRTYVIPTDTRDQFYKISSLGLNIHYDLIKFKAASIVTTGGAFVNYSSGLFGTGGWPEENNNSSEYFHALYFGGSFSLAVRINPKKSKLAYEVKPLNIHFGNKGFILSYLMFGIDFKINK